MYNGGKIFVGILIFIIVFTSPIWTNWLNREEAHKPNIVLPKDYKECVAETGYMKANHMDLLNRWRDLVVRENIRFLEKDGQPYLIDGKKTEMSLTKTCLKCHNNKENFCDECHNYLDVSPYCWDCHVSKYNPKDVEECPEHLKLEVNVEEKMEAEK